jgi:hypothetical protein
MGVFTGFIDKELMKIQEVSPDDLFCAGLQQTNMEGKKF